MSEGTARAFRRIASLVLISVVWALSASAQTTLQWERFGNLLLDGFRPPSFDADGKMWFTGTANEVDGTPYLSGLFSLDAPYDTTSQWDQEVDIFVGPFISRSVFAISPRTLLATGARYYRSTDSGATWSELNGTPEEVQQWFEIPAGGPHAGRILVAKGFSMAIYSDDRGVTFLPAQRPGAVAPDAQVLRLTVITAGPNTGRVLGGGLSGITKSDDGGQTWAPTPEYANFQIRANCIGTLRGQAPGGGDRVVSVIDDGRIADDSIRVSLSDDGGETWRRPQALLQGAFRSCAELVDLGGGRAVAVLTRGPIYGTEDAGETWTKWSDWPGPPPPDDTATFTHWATLGPDGHLYVGLTHNGPPNNYDVRTTVPVGYVTSASPPVVAPSLTLSVRPNPSGGRVSVVLEAAEPSIVRLSVTDALGREVALVFDGPVAARREVSLSTTGLAPGVYVLRASTEGRPDASTRFTVAQ